MIQITHLLYKEFFWEKWLLLFVDLLFSVMLLNISKRFLEYIMILTFAKIWANSVLNYAFTSNEDFPQKINYHHLCLSSKPHHPTFQTNPSGWSLDQRYIFCQNFSHFLLQVKQLLSEISMFWKTDKLFTKNFFQVLLKCIIVSDIYKHVHHKIQGSIILEDKLA